MILTILSASSLTDNAELLKQRQKALEDSKEQLDRSLKEQISYNRTLEREMQKLKPDIRQLVRQREKHSVYVYRRFRRGIRKTFFFGDTVFRTFYFYLTDG